MDISEIHLSPNHQVVVNRFVAACQADERVVAAFLSGSYARGAADAHSDLDLGLITTDEAREAFLAGRETFIRQLGEPLFLEDFGSSDTVFFILSEGSECELGVGCESRFQHLYPGPHRVLLDKKGLLAGVTFPWPQADAAEQRETLRREITWFWHDLSHFITALGRGQLWWTYGQLEILRRMVVTLARLRYNFLDPDTGEEVYFKIERVLPDEQLSPLAATYCPLEPEAMLRAAWIIVRFYQELAPLLAQTHGLPYPVELERVMVGRLEKLGKP